MSELSELPNIGKVAEKQLRGIGVKTPEDLRKMGSVEAVIKIGISLGSVKKNTCLSKLYALEGAIKGIRWHDLSKGEKERVKKEYREKLEQLS